MSVLIAAAMPNLTKVLSSKVLQRLHSSPESLRIPEKDSDCSRCWGVNKSTEITVTKEQERETERERERERERENNKQP